ncbi:MAG: hypothetical protein ABW005_11265 [Burkholderiaceae bacterium]
MQQIAVYEYMSPAGRFAISLRPYGRWRVRCANGLLDRSFATAQQALDALAQADWPVPNKLAGWTPLSAHSGTTVAGELDPLD